MWPDDVITSVSGHEKVETHLDEITLNQGAGAGQKTPEIFGEFYTFAKLVLFRLLVLVVRDLLITISAIAYNVNNNLDEVLLAIVCTVYSGNIINRSRLAPKVAVTRAFVAPGARTCISRGDKLDRMLKVSIPHSHISR